MAIVYGGNHISIYRNGEPYTSYQANNIDLLGTGQFAVFGLRHMGSGPANFPRFHRRRQIYDRA